MEEKKKKNGERNPMIFYRLRPSTDFAYENIKVQDNFKVVHARRVQDCSPNIFNAPLYLEYKCDSVFYRHSQQIIYASVMKDVLARKDIGCFVNRVAEGSDATIFAYGQTGSGKTHTMTGLWKTFEETGIIPQFLADMFELQTKLVLESLIVYKMSFVELIEPADVKDLLAIKEDKRTSKLKYQDKLKNASRLVIPSETDALRLLFLGESQRSVDRTATYPGANVSHTVLTIYIETTSLIKSLPVVTSGKIHFVDMMGTNCAGNEKCRLPPRLQGQGNLAKMLLEQYFSHMNQSDKQPLSQNWTSIVIDYLGESLSRQAIMRFIGHIHGSTTDLEVTHSTLRFGTVIGAVRPIPLAKHVGVDSIQQKINDQEELDCQNQHRLMNEDCQRELLLNFGEERLSNARIAHLRRLVPHFLMGEVPAEVIIALHQMPLFLELCKERITSMGREKRENTVLLGALRKEEELLLRERTLMAERESLSSRTRSSLKGLGNRSLESQKSIRTSSKEGGTSRQSRGGKSAEKVKRDVSETSKKSKSSSRNTRASFAETSREMLTESEFLVRHAPSRSVAWAMYMMGAAAKELKKAVKDAEAAYKLTNKEYEKTRADVMTASEHLEETRKELFLVQKLRHLTKEETSTQRGGFRDGGKEKTLDDLCKEREAELNTNLESMQMQTLLKSETETKLAAARTMIENNYLGFCIANYGVPASGFGLEDDEEISSQNTVKSVEIFFNKMQNKILLHLKSRDSVTPKARTQSFYSEKCFSDDFPFKNL